MQMSEAAMADGGKEKRPVGWEKVSKKTAG